jgi:hypothetical protein
MHVQGGDVDPGATSEVHVFDAHGRVRGRQF